MNGTRLQLELNLQTVSMVSLATKLWDIPDIKNKIKKYFLEEKNDAYPPRKSCYEISRNVLQYLNSIELPSSILIKVQKMVVVIGEKIYDWIQHVTEFLRFDFVFTEKIYWSSYGTVDEVKIFNLYWRDIMSAPGFSNTSKYLRHSPVFSLACMYGEERFIQEHRSEMIDELEKFYPSIRTSPTENEVFNVMSASIFFTLNGNMREFGDNAGRPLDMYKMCLEAGFSRAAGFYWSRLDEIEKISDVADFLGKCFKRHDERKIFIQEKCCEMFVFLIDQMQEEVKRTFLSENADKIITMLIQAWPYQELILVLLDYDWTVESSELLILLNFIIESKGRFNEAECPMENQIYFEIVEKIWGKLSGDDKFSYVRENGKNLFVNFDVPTLNLILTDPNLVRHGYRVGKTAVSNGCEELVKRGKFHLIDEFMEKVSHSNEPKEKLKKNYSSIVNDLVRDEKFVIIDQFLDWLAISGEERAALKNGFDGFNICRDLIERLHDFELAQQFLKWRYETEEEIRIFKERMKSGNFVIRSGGEYIRIRTGDFPNMLPGDALEVVSKNLKEIEARDLVEMEAGSVRELIQNSFTHLRSKYFKGRRSGDPADTICSSTQIVSFVGRKSGDYILYNICKIWNEKCKTDPLRNIKIAVHTSTALIKFFYETDEEVAQFKQSQLVIINDEHFIEIMFKTLFKEHTYIRYEILNEFLKFLSISPEEIENVKGRFRDEIDRWLDVYLIDHFHLELAEFLINWLYESAGREKRIEAIKKYLNSSNKSAVLSYTYLHRMREYENFSGSMIFKICNWLIMVDDVEKLKNDLRALDGNTPEWFFSLLDKLAMKDVLSAVNAVRMEYYGVGVSGAVVP